MFTIMTAVCALVMILSGLFALTLGMVFKRAVEYKRENELTIDAEGEHDKGES